VTTWGSNSPTNVHEIFTESFDGRHTRHRKPQASHFIKIKREQLMLGSKPTCRTWE